MKSKFSECESMGLCSEEFIFVVKIKLRNILGYIRVFLRCFTVFVAYLCYKFAPIFLNFESLPSKNSRCAPVKEN